MAKKTEKKPAAKPGNSKKDDTKVNFDFLNINPSLLISLYHDQ